MSNYRVGSKQQLVHAEFPEELPCKIAFVGEAPGENEALTGRPFVGSAGKLFNKFLERAGIDRSECAVMNVFEKRPPENKVDWFFVKKTQAKRMGYEPNTPEFKGHGFIHPKWAHELERLRNDIERADPNVIVALGATALWALTGESGIGSYRGSILPCLFHSAKVIPTYHPAAVMRQWEFRPVVGLDLVRAREESGTRDIAHVEREIWIEPDLEDLEEFARRYLRDAHTISFDIETDYKETKSIQCIGLSADHKHAIVVPFMDRTKPGMNYWDTKQDEVSAWMFVKEILEDPNTVKVAQNGMYDVQWLDRRAGIKVRGILEDTMILHHALQPELPKDLGFLGSVYTEEKFAWKNLVSFKGNKKET